MNINYFKIAWRNLKSNRTFSFINIFGLAAGLTGFMIILLYLNYELSYDTWDTSLKRVCKVSLRTDEDILPTTPAPLAEFLKEQLPAIEAATTMQPAGDFEVLLSTAEKKIFQKGGIEADSCFLKVFPYKISGGNAATVLDKPNAIIISRDLAAKLFDNANPIGKTIKIFNAFECEVTGIIEIPSTPAHFNTQFIYRSPYEKSNNFWENYSYQTYVKTKSDKSGPELEKEINTVYYNARLKKNNQSLDAFRKAGHQEGLFVDAVTDIHNFPKHGSSNFVTVSVLLLLASLLLLAGAINFSNLSIAASVRRAKEVGVRKVLGSGRRRLQWLFICEIALQCFLSLCMALLLVNLLLPYFNSSFNINLSFFQSGRIMSLSLQIVLCLLGVIILSGLYPSFFLARYNITKVLKGDYTRGTKGTAFRNSLIVVQFVVAAFFIMSTLVIRNQMHFMQTKDKGFAADQVMRLETPQKVRDKNFDLTRSVLLNIPGVQYVSKTTTVPGDAISDTSTITFKCSEKEYRMVSVKVSDDYFKTLSIGLTGGRLFDSRYADQNTRTAVINESAAKKLNIENPIGATISFPYCDSVAVQVIGIVKDFNVSGFERMIQPTVFTIGNKACMFQSGGGILVKLNGGQVKKSVAAIENAWKTIEPDTPIRYSFLDDNFQKLFAAHVRLQKIITFFALSAILISIMGLFALTAFLVSQRTKEIGIRKILGAGISDLGLLLSKDFIRLILVSVLIAMPLGWWAAKVWLQSFSYRINISGWIFIAAGAIIITIAAITISFQAIKAVIASPVKSLRTE